MFAEFDTLIKSLDLPAKVRLLTGASIFTLAPQESIGLGAMNFSDGPTGVRGLKFHGGRIVALLPNATLLASAWSESVTHEVGRILAEEALAQEIHVVLGPTINLHRTPLGGRLFEAYSEDPLLTGKLAAAYVRGLQEQGVGASLKHLVANESETDRNSVDSVVDEATLRELYLLPFEIAVAEADAWTLMAAYNDVNGVAATEQNHVNNEIVKGEWGYSGLIMSDWFATKTTAPSANGGLDLVMPGPGGPWGDQLVAAVHAGEVDESTVDDHLRRLLLLASRVGALGQPATRRPPTPRAGVAAKPATPAPDSPQRREQLTRLAAQGMTVLTNRDDVLPLHPERSVALIGRHATDTIGMGGGSAQVNPPYQVSIAAGLAARYGDRLTVTDGVDVRNRPTPARRGFVVDPVTGAPGVRFTLYDAAGAVIEERHSTSATTMVGLDDDFDATVASIRLTAAVPTGGRIEVGTIGPGDWTLGAGSVVATYPLRVSGSGLGEEILAPPAYTTVAEVADGGVVDATVLLLSKESGAPLAGVGQFGLVARPAPRPVDEVLADAVRAATGADVAVVVVGLTEEQETEAVDKSTLRLPGEQDALVEAVAGAARRTVVVVNAATPVLMPWRDRVDAVLWAGLPGQEAGHAVAAALVGAFEPAGRLVTTFPTDDAATPAWAVTPVDGAVVYAEGTFIGYRGHHAARAPEPAFWFGHGLGYGTWRYDSATLVGDAAGEAAVEVTVTNTGARPSREVVQVYLEPAEADQPVRLVGWEAVEVAPGASATVRVTGDARMWRRWDTATGAWGRLAPGGRLLVARGLGDVRAALAL
jgi:beta-glucosidase